MNQMQMQMQNPYILITAILVANLILWTLFVSPLIYILAKLLKGRQQQVLEITNLVRDFAAYVASRQDDYPSARFMLSAANREALDAQLDKAQSAGATEKMKEDRGKDQDPVPDGYTLTQKG